ncbi:hypothetical protein PN499_18020 [Kamptonema animale CS-326]|jgi:hypothetical protein|uniref:hypothetical protein n=1 Tax=Kamptonema animale TaxID=92934 RepID=UPI002330B7B8|nr:hypothetical protein [Kamptonema animale]MDB9513092.1 hypothetical protein [Kamptonema animale CS-326]
MFAIVIWSLMVGSLGIEAVIFGGWLHRYQFVEAQQSEEEEILTHYESKDDNIPVTDRIQSNSNPNSGFKDSQLIGWEFKIVRASSDLFRNPAIFHRLCEEEAQVGWILLEKLDDRRVRFKRPIAMRDMERSDLPRFDPYRSHYGSGSNWLAMLGAIVLLAAMVLPAVLGYALVSSTSIKSRSNWPDIPIQSLPASPTPEDPQLVP